MEYLKLRIPPLVVVLVMAGLMWLCSWQVPEFSFAIPFHNFIALAFVAAGVVTIILGVISFRRARTTVNPLTPAAASSLVNSGVYTYSRNPMYLGFAAILVGWGIYLSNALSLVLLPLFVLYMNRFQIGPEEEALRSLFGREFDAYAGRVRRWL